MARRRSREKQSDRDEYMLREQLKIEEGVFDTRTMLRLVKFFTKGMVSSLEFIIARGKEADVYLADAGEKMDTDFVALKIFRLENARFQNRITYIRGDPRFGKIKNTTAGVVNEWCKKEYANLLVAEGAEVHSPRPYAFSGNVLAMEFIGSDGKPARPLREERVAEPSKVLDSVIEDMTKLYKSELVHADMSEYNILMKEGTPYLIDFGQAVHIKHPDSIKFLRRDVENILRYFSKAYGIEKGAESVFNEITR